MNSSISSKGQVTVPKKLRDQLGLKAGTTVEFELAAGGVLTNELIDDMRGPRPQSRG
jgi:AbrB family looped-hinge helix DNA binding protein